MSDKAAITKSLILPMPNEPFTKNTARILPVRPSLGTSRRKNRRRWHGPAEASGGVTKNNWFYPEVYDIQTFGAQTHFFPGHIVSRVSLGPQHFHPVDSCVSIWF